MKKTILLLVLLILCSVKKINAQWVYKTVNNKIDLPYKIAYSTSTDNTAVLKLEKVNNQLDLYITGGYHCDDNPTVDIALVVGNETFRYSFRTYKSSDSETIFLVDNLLFNDSLTQDFLKNFKSSSKFLIRINETHCTDDYYEFLMGGSTKAIEFMSN